MTLGAARGAAREALELEARNAQATLAEAEAREPASDRARTAAAAP